MSPAIMRYKNDTMMSDSDQVAETVIKNQRDFARTGGTHAAAAFSRNLKLPARPQMERYAG